VIDALASPTLLDVLEATWTTPGTEHAGDLPTGFHLVDDILDGGLHPGELTVIGGKPGQGKTLLALQWARHLAVAGHRVIYACYEHDHATLLGRVLTGELAELCATRTDVDAMRLDHLRTLVRRPYTPRSLDDDRVLAEVRDRVAGYAERLMLVPGSGATFGVEEMSKLVASHDAEVLFVDYLQKVPAGESQSTERFAGVVQGVKELALSARLAVVGISAASQEGLNARRVHLHHMIGAEALAYEADVALMLNDKLSIVSKAHLAYDTTRTDEFHKRTVLSIEKNRNGLAAADLEFVKDFANQRFDPSGRWVAERLWDEGNLEA
jgi:replicative DNA helicase